MIRYLVLGLVFSATVILGYLFSSMMVQDATGGETVKLILVSEVDEKQIECRVALPALSAEVNEEMFRADGEVAVFCLNPVVEGEWKR